MKVEVVVEIFDEDFIGKIAWLRAQGVARVALDVPLTGGLQPSLDRLETATREVLDAGLQLGGVQPPWSWIDHAIDSEEELAMMKTVIEKGGELGMDCALLSCFRRDLTEMSGAEREAMAEKVRMTYREMCAIAGSHGMKLATHTSFSFFRKGSLLDTIGDWDRFFEAVPDPANGLLFCFGPCDLMGYSVADSIRHFRDRIHAVHALRELPRPERAQPDSWKRHLQIETDGVKLTDMLHLLAEVGFDGPVIPLHVPEFPGPAGMRTAEAWAIAYLHSVFARLG